MITILLTTIAIAQEKPEPVQMAERVKDVPSEWMLVLNDMNIVDADVNRLFKNLNISEEVVENVFHPAEDYGFNLSQGVVLYDTTKEYRWSQVLDLIMNEVPGQRHIRSSDGMDASQDGAQGKTKEHLDFNFLLRADYFKRKEDHLALANGYAYDLDQADWIKKCEADTQAVLTAAPLKPKLDQHSINILNQSGISILSRPEFVEWYRSWSAAELLDPANLQTFAPEDIELVERVESVLKDVKLSVVGLKYRERSLQMVAHAQTTPEKNLSELLNPELEHPKWNPDLGLEVDGLMISASMRLEAFRSARFGKLLPRIALHEAGRFQNEFQFLQGNMLKILSELIGDSWNDLSAGRVAIYYNDAMDATGQLSIFGIADARDPEVVLNELRRLDLLTCAEEVGVRETELREELVRLVAQLNSDDENVASRAETRLILAGDKALAVIESESATFDASQRERAERVTMRIEQSRNAVRDFEVARPEFWSTLQPSLKLTESTGTIGGFPSHTITVTPDPGKSEDEVKHAIEAMVYRFGPDWNKIPVVQVGDHFVFMLGSDHERLERLVANVKVGTSLLMETQEAFEGRDESGQIHAFVDPVAINAFFRRPGKLKRDDGSKTRETLSWIRLDISDLGPTVDALVPTKAIIPFLFQF
ncbi:MAG: hypothetical protein R3C03_18050 [Pirellulaceae bacterium]